MENNRNLTLNERALANPDKFRKIVIAGCFMAWMFDAQDMVLLSLALPHIIEEFNVSLVTAGGIASVGLIGTAIGALTWGTLSDKIGRKKTMILALLIFGIFTVISGFATSVTQLAVFRFIAGLGLGGESVIGGTYITETQPPEKRAFANGTVQSGFAVGYLLTILVNYFLVTNYGWRTLFWAAGLVIIAIVFFIIKVPESPAWIRNQQNKKEGKVSATEGKNYKFTDIFRGKLLRSLILTSILAISCLVAYWGIGTWLPSYLGEIGIDTKSMSGYLLSINLAAFFGYYFFGWFADKFGRRRSMYIGSIASACVTFLYLYFASPAAMVVFGAFLGFITYGYWGAMATIITEQFPTELRGTGMSISFGLGRVGSAVSPLVIGGLATNHGFRFALTMMVIVYLVGALASFLLKETKDKVIVD